ncbi:hypothetical protein [Streptomyces silvisoli]|uniref:Zinc-ribbon domain-containing protein n=1 Tax=Streptomyces silvisoli TaxID=3034235 RepID=A0ABT5ZXP0_9ACTN|nr:hypothetical protein [Streptomyces silvisoli]MDF3294264.1 hypothetical protein [Streptomyces silvisoli]
MPDTKNHRYPVRRTPAQAHTLAQKLGLEPLEAFPGWSKGWRCRCTRCGTVCTPRLGRVANGEVGPCRICGARAASARIATPEERAARMRARGYEPLEPYPGASTTWRCKHLPCGQIVQARYDTVMAGVGCCWDCGKSSRRLNPDSAVQVMRSAGYEPLEPFPGTGVNDKWRCRHLSCGQIVQAVHRRERAGNECCWACGRQKAIAALRLDHDSASLVMVMAGLEPLEPYPGHRAPWRCRCTRCGRQVTPTRAKVMSGGSGCRACGLRAAGARKRAAGAEQAVADMRAAGLEPLEIYPGADTPWHCRCTRCGDEVWPRLTTVRGGSGGCLDCGFEAAAAKQRADPRVAAADMRAAGFEPLEPYERSGIPWRCIHLLCCNEVRISLNAVRQKNGGCGHCRRTGFNRSRQAYVYVLQHPDLRAVKVGVTHVGTRRLAGFINRGWKIVGDPLCDESASDH